jgi:hypothetical protein
MTAIDQMNHPNLVVVHFNPYAGGKFWINCLSHHARAIPGLCVAVPKHDVDLWLLDDLDPQEIQRRKIDRINSSLPSAELMLKWCQDELGCAQFWGDSLRTLLINDNITVPDKSIHLLNQYCCFIVNHQPNDVECERISKRLPNARHILLTNADNFQQVSMAKKQSDPWPLKYDTTSDLDAFVVDVDNTYMNVDRTIDRVKDCLQYLGLSTELHPNIYNFVKRYFDLHRHQDQIF